jgi:hypothetical protein
MVQELGDMTAALGQADASDMRSRHEAATRPDRLKSPQASLCVAGALVSEEGHAP